MALSLPNYKNVGLMGDTHGDALWVTEAIQRFANLGITHVLHVGDFKVWPGAEGATHLKQVNDELAKHGMLMIVTPGNHEDYVQLEQVTASALVADFHSLPAHPHVLFAERGQHWSWDGVEFVSLGGANSIDRYSNVEGISWWAQESITLGDVYRTAEAGPAEIMITHDCPAGVPILSALTAEAQNASWPEKSTAYAQQSRAMLRQAVDHVRPELLIHGHYHVHADFTVELQAATGEAYTLRSVGLDKEHTAGNLAILQPALRKVTLLDK